MATREQLIEALRRADAAGDTEAAQRFAELIKATPATGVQAPVAETPAAQDGGTGIFQATDDIVRLIANGLTLGWADNLAAKVERNDVETQNRLSDEARDRAGIPGVIAEVGGAVGPLAAVNLPRIIPAATRGGRRLLAEMGILGVEGAGTGAIAAGAKGEDLGDAALQDGAFSALMGPVGSVASKVGGRIVGALTGKTGTPRSLDELRAAKDEAYKAADQVGATFDPNDYLSALNKSAQEFDAARFDPKSHTESLNKITKMIDDAQHRASTNTRYTLGDLDLDRQYTKDIPDEGGQFRFREILQGNIDDLIDTNAAGSEALGTARDAARRYMRTDELQQALYGRNIRRGERMASNAAANRSAAAGILANPAKRRGFKPNEIEALEAIAIPSRGARIAEAIGKFGGSTGTGLATTGVGVGAGLGASFGTGDPNFLALGLAVPTVGALGRAVANRASRRSVDNAFREIDGTPPPFAFKPRRSTDIARIAAQLGMTEEELLAAQGN